MQPLHVRFWLTTPMRAPEAPIHLDALLAWSAVHATAPPDLTRQEALPLERYTAADGRWVWKASRLVFTPIHRQALPLTRRLDVDECARDQGVYFEAPRLNTLTPGTGVWKSYSFRAPLVQVETVDAWCVGEADTVQQMLSGISNIGKLGRLDCGRVREICVEPDDAPERDRWRLRTMPDACPDYYTTAATLRPPYWRRENREEAWEPSSQVLRAAG